MAGAKIVAIDDMERKRLANGQRLIRRVVKRLEQRYTPRSIILFGSFAEGRAGRDSDIDLLIVKETATPFFQRLVDVREAVWPLMDGRPFDPIVLTPAELRRRLRRGDQFLQGIVRKGKLLYARDN